MLVLLFFFFKQKTAYEMRISDWSSDVCSSDLGDGDRLHRQGLALGASLGHREEGALEGEDAVAVARGPLGKQDKVIACLQPTGHLVAVPRGMTAATLDEDGLLQAGEPGQEGHGGDLRLRHEGNREERTEPPSSDERRVGQKGVSPYRSRRSQYH